MNGPRREYPPSGHTETVDLAIIRQRKQLLAVVDPGEELIDGRAVFDWAVREETTIETVIDPNERWKGGWATHGWDSRSYVAMAMKCPSGEILTAATSKSCLKGPRSCLSVQRDQTQRFKSHNPLTILVASGEKFTARTLLMAESETVEQPADLDTIYSNSRGWQHALSFSVFSLVSYHLEYTHLCHGHRPLRFLPSIVCPGQQVSIRDERGCAESEQ